MNGIDISAWQGDANIDLNKLAYDFCVVKATEGTNYKNRYLATHCNTVLKKKRLLGVYHYANGGSPEKEADFFLSCVKKYIGKGILVLDWEGQNNEQFGKNDLEWCLKWCSYVERKSGVKPLIYVQKSAMEGVKKSGYALWIAQYANFEPTGYQEHPWNENAYACSIRQYTSSGRLAGYNNNLDLNKAYISKTTWQKRAKVKTTTSSAVKPTTKKSITTIAKEVISGKWGNGTDRKNRLTAAGYDYSKVQQMVNKLIESSKISAAKVITSVAHEVISGKWGNGNDRINRLTAAGYDAKAIQNEVNKILQEG